LAGENLRARCSTVIAQREPSFDSVFRADTHAARGEMRALTGHLTWANVCTFLPRHSRPPSALRTAVLAVTPGEAGCLQKHLSVSVHLLLLLFLLATKRKTPLKHCCRGKQLLSTIIHLYSSNSCASVLQTDVNMS